MDDCPDMQQPLTTDTRGAQGLSKATMPVAPVAIRSSNHEAILLLATALVGLAIASPVSSRSQEAPPHGKHPRYSADHPLVVSGGSLPAPDFEQPLFSVDDEINTSRAINGPFVLADNILQTLYNALEAHNISYASPDIYNDTPYPVDWYWFDLSITGNLDERHRVISVLIDQPWQAHLAYNQREDFLNRGNVIDSLYTSEYTPWEWVEQRIPQWFPNGLPGSAGEFAAVNDAKTPAAQPPALATLQNYPNPFNGTTRITFTLPTSAQIRLECFDICGRRILKEEMGMMPAGQQEWQLEIPDNQSSGQFFYMLFKDGEAVAKGKASHIK